MNMKPDLFKAVVLHFPFLDVLTCLLNDSLPLSKSDHDEFGNPIEDPDIYDLISSYSPYENLLNTEYPSVYIACGSLDYRAPLWNVLKYVNRFRDRSKNPLRVTEFSPKNLIVNVIDSGHYGDVSVASGILDKC
jgi:oligopeptidase B